mgnify:CR=1 FL=1
MYEDLKRFHLKTGLQLKTEYIQTQRYVGVKSSIIDQNHAAMLCSWIDGGDSTSIPNLTSYPGELPYEFKLLFRGSRDGLHNNFHEIFDKQDRILVNNFSSSSLVSELLLLNLFRISLCLVCSC